MNKRTDYTSNMQPMPSNTRPKPTYEELQAELARTKENWDIHLNIFIRTLDGYKAEIKRLTGILDSIYYADAAEPLENVVKRAIEKYQEKGQDNG